MSSKRGLFILFEGIDRSGKSTQCELLVKYLRKNKKLDISHLKFPDRSTNTGKLINQYLLNRSTEIDDGLIHILFSANRREKTLEMEGNLLNGKHLIVDRYAYSGVAYTAAKGTLELDLCFSPDKGILAPDIIVYLNITPKEAKKRNDYGKERYEEYIFQEKVHKVYGVLKHMG